MQKKLSNLKSKNEILILSYQIKHKWDNNKIIENLNKLPESFIDNILKYTNKEKKIASLIGKLLLIKGLKSINNYDLNEINIEKKLINSKPFIKNAPYFNISHSGDIIICAISKNYEIGIDIEKIKPIKIENFKSILSKEDLKFIKNQKDHSKAFFEIWTKKEAILKAIGTGIIPTLFKNITLNKDLGIINDVDKWYLKKINLYDEYISYLATPIKETNINFIKSNLL